MGDTDISIDVENEPRIGMIFNTENEAYYFYNFYGGRLGFSIRREYAHWRDKEKTILRSRMFVCSKQGSKRKDKRDTGHWKPKAETRTECPAKMGIVLMDNGQYRCYVFDENHNHPLYLPATLHMMKSQRKIPVVHGFEIDLVDDSGIAPKGIFEYMGRQAGGRENLGYTQVDHRIYLRTKRQRALSYGEAGNILMYFQEQTRANLSFTHSLQLDSEEQITNIFWADPRMIIDYTQFGDVITFDTTFCTNKKCRPFGLFAGFNHHRGVVIFGAALLYDETVESFKWLFQAFLEAHRGKKPITIFTDQDCAMAKAIQEVLPETWHGLCTGQLMQNGIKHLGNLMKDGSSFLSDFKACMFQYEGETEFEQAWQKLRSDYLVRDGLWLDRIYLQREKWAKCYMKKACTLGMRSTHLSESLNGDLKDYLKSSLDLVQFFKYFETVVADRRNNEVKAEFDARDKISRNSQPRHPLMKQAAEVYTPNIFELFQEEYNWVGNCFIKSRSESGAMREYVVANVDVKGEFNVLCNPSEPTVSCSCRKFETWGFLCSHALKILDYLDIKFIPAPYVLRRWTRAARTIMVEDSHGNHVQEDIQLDCTQRYRVLCPLLVKIASQASTSAEGYAFVHSTALDMCKKLENIQSDAPLPQNLGVPIEDPTVQGPKELKKIEKCEGGKQKKWWVEKQGNEKRKVKTTNSQASDQIQPCASQTSHQFQPSGYQASHQLQPCGSQTFHHSGGSHRMDNNTSFTPPLMHLMFSSQNSTSHVHSTQTERGNSYGFEDSINDSGGN